MATIDNVDLENAEVDKIPVLYSQEKYDEWIESLAKHELAVAKDSQVDPELPVSETIEDIHRWVDHSGTLAKLDYAESYYQIKKHGYIGPKQVADIDADEWYDDPRWAMETIAGNIVRSDVAGQLRELINEEEDR